MKKKYSFTHYWVTGFGWENTIFQPEDFESVEIMGVNDKDGTIFCARAESGKYHILKGAVLK